MMDLAHSLNRDSKNGSSEKNSIPNISNEQPNTAPSLFSAITSLKHAKLPLLENQSFIEQAERTKVSSFRERIHSISTNNSDEHMQRKKIERLMIGSGLGISVVQDMSKGIFKPSNFLPKLYLKREKNFSRNQMFPSDNSDNVDSIACSKYLQSLLPTEQCHISTTLAMETIEQPFQITNTTSFAEILPKVFNNILIAERHFSQAFSPFTSAIFLENCEIVYDALKYGGLSSSIELSVPEGKKLLLTGIHNIYEFGKYQLLPKILHIISTSYAVNWLLKYVITFFNLQIARTSEEAEIRDSVQSRCVRTLTSIDFFTMTSIGLQEMFEEYTYFCALKEKICVLFDSLRNAEFLIRGILCERFSNRRALLHYFEQEIMMYLQNVELHLKIIIEWNPKCYYEAQWREKVLSGIFSRLFGPISHGWFAASLGYVDEKLYALSEIFESSGNDVYDTSNHDNMSIFNRINKSDDDTLTNAEKVCAMAQKHLDLALISKKIAGKRSLVIGLQLCMSSRYILRETHHTYNDKWGFEMFEDDDNPAVADLPQFFLEKDSD